MLIISFTVKGLLLLCPMQLNSESEVLHWLFTKSRRKNSKKDTGVVEEGFKQHALFHSAPCDLQYFVK
jgi:hypothetical protein